MYEGSAPLYTKLSCCCQQAKEKQQQNIVMSHNIYYVKLNYNCNYNMLNMCFW